MPRARLTPAAADDLAAIVDYLGERNPLVAIRFVEAAQAVLEHLEHASLAYPLVGWLEPELTAIRRRPMTGSFARYLVYYIDDGKYVDVVRILHSARDTDAIFER